MIFKVKKIWNVIFPYFFFQSTWFFLQFFKKIKIYDFFFYDWMLIYAIFLTLLDKCCAIFYIYIYIFIELFFFLSGQQICTSFSQLIVQICYFLATCVQNAGISHTWYFKKKEKFSLLHCLLLILKYQIFTQFPKCMIFLQVYCEILTF